MIILCHITSLEYSFMKSQLAVYIFWHNLFERTFIYAQFNLRYRHDIFAAYCSTQLFLSMALVGSRNVFFLGFI